MSECSIDVLLLAYAKGEDEGAEWSGPVGADDRTPEQIRAQKHRFGLLSVRRTVEQTEGERLRNRSKQELYSDAVNAFERVHADLVESYADDCEERIRDAWKEWDKDGRPVRNTPDVYSIVHEICDGGLIYTWEQTAVLFASENRNAAQEEGIAGDPSDSNYDAARAVYALIQDVQAELADREVPMSEDDLPDPDDDEGEGEGGDDDPPPSAPEGPSADDDAAADTEPSPGPGVVVMKPLPGAPPLGGMLEGGPRRFSRSGQIALTAERVEDEPPAPIKDNICGGDACYGCPECPEPVEPFGPYVAPESEGPKGGLGPPFGWVDDDTER